MELLFPLLLPSQDESFNHRVSIANIICKLCLLLFDQIVPNTIDALFDSFLKPKKSETNKPASSYQTFNFLNLFLI
ncbi:hypothetical protein ERO13_A05G208650v2 [Gossypium hirsutum]|uniref:Uncharacterized protein n=2 Tax=Gossypium TaxID=3633 RepID=A0A5J5VRM7_GOSBA|nr:hypothetical protein ES319_A05G218200v1 [Gossypium barbadense]KAG4200399.1 hypothetical protein ERO13_A05G208650v2 [Gossypium hirsutum]TYJ35244.1 hypothetical protein E1A91_A05G223600v1 [Gossypium mustelinum]